MINFDEALHSILTLLRGGGSGVIVGAIITCVVTQLLKVIFINKAKIVLLKKFDISIILPFIVGTIYSLAVGLFTIKIDFEMLYTILINGLTYGATATVLFRLINSLSSTNYKKLSKDELFSYVYSQLLLLGSIQEKLLKRQMSLTDLRVMAKNIVEQATEIYSLDSDNDAKKQELAELLRLILNDDILEEAIEHIHAELSLSFDNSTTDE